MRPVLALVVALLAAVVVLVIFGGGGSEGSQGTQSGEEVYGVGQVRAGSVAALAQCTDWNEGTEEERQATIDDIYNQVNQAGADGPTPDLSDEDAYSLFEGACVNEYAAGFRLYKLYVHSAALSPLAE